MNDGPSSSGARFAGLIPPICTPLTSDGAVDEESLRTVVDFQVDAGATGIFVLGSSGEAIYLDDAARRRVVEIAGEAIRGRGHLLVGALAPTIDRVKQQIELLDGLGADAFVVTPPFYAVPSPNEILAHFRQAAAAAPRPVLAYDIPGNVGYKLAPDLAARLLSEGTVLALKDSSGDIEAFSQVIDLMGPTRTGTLLSGADTTALRALDAGADGLIPGLANVRPDLFAALLRAHTVGDHEHAAVLQQAILRLNELFRVGQRHGMGRHASEIGGLKLALHARGVIATTRLARPLEEYPPPAREEAQALLHSVEAYLAAHRVTRPEPRRA